MMDIEKLVAVALRQKAVVLIAENMVKFIPCVEKEEKQAKAPVPKKKAPDPRKQNNRKELDMGKVKALRTAGWSLEKIADEMGVSAQTIANRLKAQEGE